MQVCPVRVGGNQEAIRMTISNRNGNRSISDATHPNLHPLSLKYLSWAVEMSYHGVCINNLPSEKAGVVPSNAHTLPLN